VTPDSRRPVSTLSHSAEPTRTVPMNQPAAYLFVAMRPATNSRPGVADGGAYLSGATTAMQRLGTTMTMLASTASVQAVNGTWRFDHAFIERYSSLSQ